MFEKLKNKAKAAIPKVTNAAKHVGKAAGRAAASVGKEAKKLGKAAGEAVASVEKKAKKLVNKAVSAVPSCVKAVGAVTAKMKAAVPKYVDVAKQRGSQAAQSFEESVKKKAEEVKEKLEAKNRNILIRAKEDIAEYYRDVERGKTKKGVFYYLTSANGDALNLLLQLRKDVVEEYPILKWDRNILHSFREGARYVVVTVDDKVGNFVYNQDIPLVSDFVGGAFQASDMEGHTPTVASTVGAFVNGFYGGEFKTVDSLLGLVSDPCDTVEGINNITRQPEVAIPAICQEVKDYVVKNIIDGSAEDRSRAAGGAAFQIALLAATLGSGGAVEAGEAAVGIGEATQLAEGVADLGEVGEAAGIAGEAGEAAKAAGIAGEAGEAAKAAGIAGEAGKAVEGLEAAKGLEAAGAAKRAAEGIGAAEKASQLTEAKKAIEGIMNRIRSLLKPKELGPGADGEESISQLYDDLFKDPEPAEGESGVRIRKAEEKAGKVEGGSGAKLDKKLMKELADSGVKYNADDVVMITKTPEGKLLWLEKGNDSAGLKHIVDGHAADFTAKGVEDISSFLNEVLKTDPVKVGSGAKGPFAEYIVNGTKYRVAYGTNGYIVSFYPID